jgi:hypothetical protein
MVSAAGRGRILILENNRKGGIAVSLRCVIVVAALAAFSFTPGCKNETSDKRLIDIAIRQKAHEREVARLTSKLADLETELTGIRSALDKLAPASGLAAPGKSGQGQPVDFRETPEYRQMAAAISAIQEQLNITENRVAEAEKVLDKQKQPPKEPSGPKPPPVLNDPPELAKKLDSLVQSFAQKIADPFRRQLFEAEVEQFKRDLYDNRPPQELFQPLVDDLKERLNGETPGMLKNWGEQRLKALESATPE